MHTVPSCRQERNITYEYVRHLLLCRYPKSWDENKTTGLEWMKGFKKQHPSAIHRKAESFSLARATSSNKHTFIEFYGSIEWLLYI